MRGTLLDASAPFQSFSEKFERFIANRYPATLDSGVIESISIGRTSDAGVGMRGGYRINGAGVQSRGDYIEIPETMFPSHMFVDKGNAVPTVVFKVSDAMKAYSNAQVTKLIDNGVDKQEAIKKVRDSIPLIGYRMPKENKFVITPYVKQVHDSTLSGMQVPYWNVSWINKIFAQPFIKGYARNLISTVGVPNVWADVVAIFTETFEGYARISNTARGSVEHNASATVTNRMHQIVSYMLNIVVEYETGAQEGIMAQQNGNPLSGVAISHRERYARLMMELANNAFILFGAEGGAFDGLSQLTSEEVYSGTPADDIWAGTSTTKGADVVEALNTIIGNMQEDINFLATDVRINVSPVVYKVLKWAMHSKIYNPANPMSVLSNNFGDTDIIISNDMVKGLRASIVPDPLCSANTPWNANASDLMFITFPSVKSALEVPGELSDVVFQPTAIENYILPTYPQRDGLLRTMLKRVGEVVAPITGTVKIIRGFGEQ